MKRISQSQKLVRAPIENVLALGDPLRRALHLRFENLGSHAAQVIQGGGHRSSSLCLNASVQFLLTIDPTYAVPSSAEVTGVTRCRFGIKHLILNDKCHLIS